MLIAMSITIGLTATIFYFIKQGQEAYEVEGARSDLNQNFRAALDLITRDVQSAGAGIPRFLGPVIGKDGGTGPDQIMLLYGNSDFVPIIINNAVSSTATSIPVPGSGTGFTAGQNYILFTPRVNSTIVADDSNRAEFSMFTLDSFSTTAGITTLIPKTSGAISVDPSSEYTHTLSFPDSTTLAITALQEIVEYRIDATNKTLQRRRRLGDQAANGSSNTWVDVARGITDLQFQYFIETVDTSTTPPTFTASIVDQVNKAADNNRALIRGVRFKLTAETQMNSAGGRQGGDGQGQRTLSQTVYVAPRNLTLPGFIPNR